MRAIPLLLVLSGTFCLVSGSAVHAQKPKKSAPPSTSHSVKKSVKTGQTTISPVLLSSGKLLRASVHHKLFGDSQIALGQHEVYFHVLSTDLSFYMTRPYATVTAYCKATGKYFVSDRHHFVNPFSKSRALLSGVSYKDIPIKYDGNEKLLGLDTRIFSNTAAYAKEVKAKYLKREMSDSQPEKIRGNYLTVDADSEVIKVLNQLLSCPDVHSAFCIKMDIEELCTDKVPYIDTSKINFVKSDAALSKSFEMPRGLKKADSMQEVIQNESAGEAIRMMLEGRGDKP